MKWRERFLVLKKYLAPWVILGFLGTPGAEMLPRVEPGRVVPALKLESIAHGQVELAQFRGIPVFLSFISTDQKASLSRSQIVFLKSILNQYSSAGVKVFLIEASSVDSRPTAKQADLVNFTFDWELDSIPLLLDQPEDSAANRYGVRDLPTTFLVGAEGFLADRWDGLATTAQLAMALQQCLQTPATDQEALESCSGEGMRRAVFPGLPPAIRLNDCIWLVQDEKPWKVGQAKTLRWVVLRPEIKIARGKIKLLVTERIHDDGESRKLIDEVVDPLPESEALPLTESLAGSFTGVYLQTGTAAFLRAGCHEVEVRVVDYNSGSILSQGDMSVSVE